MANILTEVIVELLDDLDRILTPDGTFICSGIIQANKHTVIDKMDVLGFLPVEICEREEWIAIVAKRK